MICRIFAVIIILAGLLIGFGCKSKTVVKKLKNLDSNSNQDPKSKSITNKVDGIMYFLPKTVVQANITVKKVTKLRGQFWKFAPCFFNSRELEDFIPEDGKSFSVSQTTFTPKGVPDTSQTYVIKTKGRYFETKTLFAEYAPNTYVLQKGEAESKDETLEFTVKALSTAAGVASKLVPLAISSGDTAGNKKIELKEEINCLNEVQKFIGGDKNEENLIAVTAKAEDKETNASRKKELNKLKAEFYETDATAGSLRDKLNDLVESNKEFKASEDERKLSGEYDSAKDLFEEYKNLLQSRRGIFKIANPNIPPETFKAMVEKNEEEIAAIKAEFLGNQSEKLWAAVYDFIPDGKYNDDYNQYETNSDLIFAYSKSKGVCISGKIKEKSISIGSGFQYKDCDKTEDGEIETLWLNVKRKDTSFLKSLHTGFVNAENKDKSRGWYYRVPADADVFLRTASSKCAGADEKYDCSSISFKEKGTEEKIIPPSGFKQISTAEMQIAQFGIIASVPASTAGRSSSTTITLDPATGAMKNFKVSSTALIDKSILDEAGKAANSAIDAVDPLNRKKRELEELQIQNQINTEKKKLTNSSANENEEN